LIQGVFLVPDLESDPMKGFSPQTLFSGPNLGLCVVGGRRAGRGGWEGISEVKPRTKFYKLRIGS
jgi:hypothetical protein